MTSSFVVTKAKEGVMVVFNDPVEVINLDEDVFLKLVLECFEKSKGGFPLAPEKNLVGLGVYVASKTEINRFRKKAKKNILGV